MEDTSLCNYDEGSSSRLDVPHRKRMGAAKRRDMENEKMYAQTLNIINETGDSYMKKMFKRQGGNDDKVDEKLFSRLHMDGKHKQ